MTLKQTITCTRCSSQVSLGEEAEDGYRFVPLGALDGWQFNTKDGWRCPKHFNAEGDT